MTDRTVSQSPVSQSPAIIYGLKRRVTSPPWLARAAGAGLSSVSVGFVLLFLFILERGGELTLITQPFPMRIVLILPNLVVVLSLGTVVGAILAWWNCYWSLPARIHQTILAILGIGFVWQLSTLGFVAV